MLTGANTENFEPPSFCNDINLGEQTKKLLSYTITALDRLQKKIINQVNNLKTHNLYYQSNKPDLIES